VVQSFRLEGQLSQRAIDTLQQENLRRRYLMMASILPDNEAPGLPPHREPVLGKMNREVEDYFDVEYQSVRQASVTVHIYDLVTGRMIFDQTFRSDDDGVSLATERKVRKYVGNSLIATLSNSLSNGFRYTEYPPAPKQNDVINYIWHRVSTSIPRFIR